MPLFGFSGLVNTEWDSDTLSFKVRGFAGPARPLLLCLWKTLRLGELGLALSWGSGERGGMLAPGWLEPDDFLNRRA